MLIRIFTGFILKGVAEATTTIYNYIPLYNLIIKYASKPDNKILFENFYDMILCLFLLSKDDLL